MFQKFSYSIRLLFRCGLALLALTALARAAEPLPTIPNRVVNVRTQDTGAQMIGSVLVYNVYTSKAGSPATDDTQVTITNTHQSEEVFAHFFFVNGATGTVGDGFVCLRPTQSASLLASALDPEVTGYVVVVATNNKGIPINFNHLMGSAQVKFGSGHQASLGAEAYRALFNRPIVPGFDPENDGVATLRFDGVMYEQFATELVLDNVPSVVDGHQTMLILNSLSGNFATSLTPLGGILGILHTRPDQPPVSFIAGNNSRASQFRDVFTPTFPLTQPRFPTLLPAGERGWMRLITPRSNRGMSGAVLYFHPETSTRPGVFNGGRNLPRKVLGNASLDIPVFAPTC